ncbi:hypothetical protein [Pseudomonas guariconensis]|uniref:hypothetical protein n=1 Tax=Pseudomonas guariconensis TaxID=1288410 RepID=UPI0018ABA8DF|nr:hypothetical protein [Pseudomonas guariconensis]MBF8742362.1 hypothetical protein [Pseudomonas guariconensis]MBF8751527.1 hypothetical protein [Pseudomonas guariconensis]
MKIAAVIVLYKKSYVDSIALQSLLKMFDDRNNDIDFHLYVWNNSPEINDVLIHSKVTWLEGNNSTLPKIYNDVAALAFADGADALLLSDDDTDYSTYDLEHTCSVLRGREIYTEPFGCIIPNISAAGKIVSPGRRFLFKGYVIDQVTEGVVSSNNLLAINSGIVITKDFYERNNMLYDERLNFYGTDTDFFIRYESFYEFIYVCPSVLKHSLSEQSIETADRALFRWRDNLYAINIMFEKRSRAFKIAMRSYYFLLRCKLAVSYRDIRFLK